MPKSARLTFIDLARAITVLMMVQGHALHVFLDPAWKDNVPFEIWLFIRGLTAPMFMTLAGFSFSVATLKNWDGHLVAGPRVWARVRRFSFFLLLGYVLHIPYRPIGRLMVMGPEGWHRWLQADVLQLIATTLLTLQLLVYLTKRPQRFAAVTAAMGLSIFLLSPLVRAVPWPEYLWAPLAAYLSSAQGSLFPWFGWAGYVLLGAAMGVLYVQRFVNAPSRGTRATIVAGLMIVGLATIIGLALRPLMSATIIPESKPSFLLARLGGVLLLLSLFMGLTRRVRRLPRPLQALAEESLVIYVAHLAIFYGSIWNRGLQKSFKDAFGPGETLLIIIGALVSMIGVAYAWNQFKRRYPRGKHAARVAIAIGLAIPMF